MKAAWVDGSFDGSISPHDEGFLLGNGVFETMGVFDGSLSLWSAHLRRLERGADALGIPFQPRRDLPDIALELLAREPGDDVLRLTLSAGVQGDPTWCMTTRRRVASDGPVRLHVASPMAPRRNAAIKTTSRALYAILLREARASGADDALLLGADGGVLETTTANVFFWVGDELRTPRLDGCVLPGVAREAMIGSLAAVSARVEESDWTITDIENGDGFFVTNAVYGPRPATLPNVDAVMLRPVVREAWRLATSRPHD